ncbi:hypothetical protein BZG36_02370 [Bifiguratus adelaidae]|uniref:Sister chromatid cohesion protein n=1 Tax=Bifiguratus adelaidae TaxID=1938954 RepID=A0A261Y164_9FUNG|nr:hypothetical protein BZG36_02370 [Bifiguratus adelaidae]
MKREDADAYFHLASRSALGTCVSALDALEVLQVPTCTEDGIRVLDISSDLQPYKDFVDMPVSKLDSFGYDLQAEMRLLQAELGRLDLSYIQLQSLPYLGEGFPHVADTSRLSVAEDYDLENGSISDMLLNDLAKNAKCYKAIDAGHSTPNPSIQDADDFLSLYIRSPVPADQARTPPMPQEHREVTRSHSVQQKNADSWPDAAKGASPSCNVSKSPKTSNASTKRKRMPGEMVVDIAVGDVSKDSTNDRSSPSTLEQCQSTFDSKVIETKENLVQESVSVVKENASPRSAASSHTIGSTYVEPKSFDPESILDDFNDFVDLICCAEDLWMSGRHDVDNYPQDLRGLLAKTTTETPVLTHASLQKLVTEYKRCAKVNKLADVNSTSLRRVFRCIEETIRSEDGHIFTTAKTKNMASSENQASDATPSLEIEKHGLDAVHTLLQFLVTGYGHLPKQLYSEDTLSTALRLVKSHLDYYATLSAKQGELDIKESKAKGAKGKANAKRKAAAVLIEHIIAHLSGTFTAVLDLFLKIADMERLPDGVVYSACFTATDTFFLDSNCDPSLWNSSQSASMRMLKHTTIQLLCKIFVNYPVQRTWLLGEILANIPRGNREFSSHLQYLLSDGTSLRMHSALLVLLLQSAMDGPTTSKENNESSTTDVAKKEVSTSAEEKTLPDVDVSDGVKVASQLSAFALKFLLNKCSKAGKSSEENEYKDVLTSFMEDVLLLLENTPWPVAAIIAFVFVRQLMTHMDESNSDPAIKLIGVEWLGTIGAYVCKSKHHAKLKKEESAKEAGNDASTLKPLDLQQPLRNDFDSMLARIISQSSNQVVAVRIKSLKALGVIITNDSTILQRGMVISAVRDRMQDASPSVRDSAIDLIARSATAKGSITPEYYAFIAERILDPGVNVRKRVMRLLRSIYSNDSDLERRIDIGIRLLGRMNDEEENVQELALKLSQELWLSVDYDDYLNSVKDKDVGLSTSFTKLAIPKQQAIEETWSVLKGIVSKSAKPSDLACLESVLKASASLEAKNLSKLHLVNCQWIVDCSLHRLAEAQAGDVAVAQLTIIHMIAKANPHVLSGARTAFLTPFLADASQAKEQRVQYYALMTFELAIPFLRNPEPKFLNQLEQYFFNLLSNSPQSILAIAVASLCKLVETQTHNHAKLVKLLATCIAKLQAERDRVMDNQQVTGVRNVMRLLIIVSLLIKHFDFEGLRERKDIQDDLDQISKGPISDKVFDLVIAFAQPNVKTTDKSADAFRAVALRSLGHLYAFKPVLTIKPASTVALENILKEGSKPLRCQVMRIFADFLEHELGAHRANGKGDHFETLAGVSDEQTNASISTSLMQRFRPAIVDGTLDVDRELSACAFEVLCQMARHGLDSPSNVMPAIVAMETSPSRDIREKACKIHTFIYEKYKSLLGSKNVESLLCAFDYQQKLISARLIQGYIQESQGRQFISLLDHMYKVLRSNRRVRNTFLSGLFKKFDIDVNNVADNELDLQLLCFLSDNLLLFDYKVVDEVHYCIYQADRILSTSGENLRSLIDDSDLSNEVEGDDYDIPNLARAAAAMNILQRLRDQLRSIYAIPEIWANVVKKKVEMTHDVITPSQFNLVANTLHTQTEQQYVGEHLPPVGTPLPPNWHLAYFPPRILEHNLAPDGYEVNHAPPEPYIQRMWAGGELAFSGDNRLAVGDSAKLTTTVKDIEIKQGKRGVNCFVWLNKDIENQHGWCLRDTRCLVYMNRGKAGERKHLTASKIPDFQQVIHPSAVLLFRYSALTFNSHLIHYDHEYATQVEGHASCLVHGPLTCTLLLDLLRANLNPKKHHIRSFSYRALAPLYMHEPLTVCGKLHVKKDGSSHCTYDLWAKNSQNGLAMSGTAIVEEV